ncbi:MAG: tRNA (N6-isopentenyl adenosine(37)-C2)-methylthiotransferase MiaB [Solobacterium sp.]|nr:tRNA (N6-isopentenyl adenosine(37)-C2)-methylthiotransferase MiaB [Solobacterium sp.]
MDQKHSEYKLPDRKQALKRTRDAVESSYDLFEVSSGAAGLGRGKTYYLRTYGCQANVRDGETMAGMLEMMGFSSCENEEEADLLLFNTCAVRKAAEDRVLGEIGSLKTLKKRHPEKKIALCGCMAQEENIVDLLIQKYPQVDLVFGTHNIYRLPELLRRCMQDNERVIEVFSEEGRVVENMPVRRSHPAKGFVNIMYGCNKFCTYCIVPYTRGKERSRRQEDILKEIISLKEEGRKEAVLLGQNVNAYGKDLGMQDGFTDLLCACAETGIERIRFYTSHPRDYSISTIEAMRRYPNIMKSLHLPVQSGSDEILRRMARGYTAGSYMELYDAMKERIPEITFTTDLIVGFPGETDEQFQKTLDLVEHCRFDLAYTFIYSPRSGTPAASMPDDIPFEVKKQRLQILNDKIADSALANNREYLGRTVKVLCEGSSRKKADVYSGYSEENKLVNFTGPEGLENRIVDVKVTGVHSFSLDGEAL